MKRNKIALVGFTLALLFSVGILIRGVALLQAPPTGTWAPTSGPMATARAGASAALLPDGRVLITGGCSAAVTSGVCSAPLASAEFLNADGNFYPASSMNYARSGHTATVLADGRVLVAGGADASGALQTAEIFDPTANAWSAAGLLLSPRSGHTASLLQDGTVLIAGGTANGAALNSIEIFDPSQKKFAPVAGTLSSPRQAHAAALLSDGRVLIVGGWDGTTSTPVPPATSGAPNVLASSDIYDPAAGTVAPGPAMSTARMNFTATVQLDGKVFVAGGSDGSADLASAEVFDPPASTWSLAPSTLSTARSGHQAFLLPHSSTILVVGGTSNGTAVSSAELYTPWTGSVAPTGSMNSARAASVGSPLSQTVQGSSVGIDGTLMVAGGYSSTPNSPLPGAEVYGYSWIKTDHADYAPGTTVTITGGGWQPNETLAISLVESPYFDTHRPYTVTVGPDGTFTSQTMTSQDASCATDDTHCTFAPDEHDINIEFILTAVGSASQAQTTFTDSAAPSVSCTPSPVGVNAPTTCTATESGAGGDGDGISWSASGSGSFSPTTCVLSGNPGTCSVSFTPTAVGTGSQTITATDSNKSGTFTLTVVTPTTTAVTSSGSPSTYGNSVTFTATVSPNAGSIGTVNFEDGGTTITGCGAVALASSKATCMTSALSVSGSPHSITAVYGGGTGFGGSTSPALSQTVNKATPTITFGTAPTPTYLGGNFTVSATTTNTDSATLTYSGVSGPCTWVSGATFSPNGAGTCVVEAIGAASANFNAANAQQNVTIAKATPTLSVSNSPETYNGSPQSATVGGSTAGTVSNVKYNSSSTAPTSAGTYAVTADFTPTDTTDYNSLTGAPAGNFVISQATPTLSVTNSPVTYNGSPQAASVTGSVAGTVSNIRYNGSATVPTAASTYAITANFTPTDSTNYSSLSGASAGSFVIQKATPTLSVTNTPVTYDGAAHSATVTGSVAGTASNILTGGAAAQTTAGTYAVTANFTPSDTTNYNSLTAASAGNFIINKATPTLSVTNTPVTYDGNPHSATVSASTPGTVSNILTGGAASQTTAGTYPVTANFTPTDTTNYNSLTGASAGNFVINKATPTISVTNSPVPFDGAVHAATVTGSVPGTASNILTGGAASQTNAGTYAVTANFAPTDSTNYNSLTGAPAGSFIISKATPTVTVSGGPFTYDGNSHAATATAVGVDGHTAVTGSFSFTYTPPGNSTAPTNAGTYNVTANFTSSDGNYSNTSGAGSITINKVTPTFSTLTASQTIPYSQASINLAGKLSGYAMMPGTVTITIDGLSSGPLTLMGTPNNFSDSFGTSTIPASATPYTITYTYSGDANSTTATDISTTLTVNKATPTATLAVSNTPQTYNGSGQAATVSISASSVPGSVSNILTGGAASQTAVGTYAVTANFTPTDSADYNTLTALSAGNFVIQKATPTATLVVSNSPQTYSGSPQSATVSVSTSSVPGSVSNILTGGAASQTAVGTYAVTATFTPTDSTDYNTLTALSAGPFIIQKATPTATLTVSNSSQTYSGSPQSAAVGISTSSVPGSVSNILTGGAASQTAAGTYAVTATFTPTDSTNYNTLTGLSAGNFIIQPATATVTLNNLTQIYTGSPLMPTVTTNPVGLSYTLSGAPDTAPGSYPVTATVTDPNYQGSASDTFNVTGIAPTITSDPGATFTAGSSGSFTVTTMGIPTASLGETGTLPDTVTFTDNHDGTATIAGTATLAGSYPITITAANIVGSVTQTFTLTVSPGDFTQLQLLVPGETAAPGTSTGKTGTPNIEYVNGAFPVTVNAVDANWNLVNSVTNTLHFTSSDLDPNTILPTDTPLAAGTGAFSVTLETVENSPATTITVTDVTDGSKTESISAQLEVIVVYTANISPTDWATGQQASYTLTVNNAAAPNANNLASVEVAVPLADQGTIGTPTVTAPANWTYDASLLPATMRFYANTTNDAVTPGGAITITFNATSNASVNSDPVAEAWNTTAYSDAASTNSLPLAPPEPTVNIGAAPTITSADHTTSEFTFGASGTFTVSATGVPRPSLSESGSLDGLTFTDNHDGTATLAGTPTSAGSFPLTFTAHNGYGNDATQTFTLSVNKANATISVIPYHVTYDANPHTASATATGVGGVDLSSDLDLSHTTNTNAATYSSDYWTFTDPTGNYNNVSNTIITDQIDPKPETVTLTNMEQTYNGSLLSPTVTTSPDAGVTFSLTGAPQTNAASYPVTATITNPNYVGTASGTFKIDPKPETVTLTNMEQTYNGSPLSPTVTTSPDAGVAFSLTGAPQTNAASYPVTATITNPNYVGTASGTFKIDPKPETVTLTNMEQTYNGSPLSPTVTTSPDAGVTFNLTGAPQTNAASYPVTATITNPNYVGTASGTFKIDPKPETVTLTNMEQTYNGSPLSPTVTTSPDAGVTFNLTGAPQTNAGSYPVTATITNPNYVGTASGTFKIDPASSTTTVTGGTFTYDAYPHAATAVVSGVGSGITQTVSWSYAGTCTSAPITVPQGSNCTATATYAGDSNHLGSSGNATVTITARPITVTANPQTKVYGSTDPVLTYNITSGSLALGDAFTGALSRVAGENVGIYAIGQGMLSINNIVDYNFTFVGANLTITPASTLTGIISKINTPLANPASITLTATVTNINTSPVPMGTVTFMDTSTHTQIGAIQTLDSYGKASVTTDSNTLGVGPHVVQAIYTPTTINFVGSSSALTTPAVTITGPTSGELDAVNTTVNYSACFKDSSVSSPSAVWLFSAPDNAPGTTGAFVGNVIVPPATTCTGTNNNITGSNVFTAADIYNISLTFNDGLGGLDIENEVSAPSQAINLPAYDVVYDPSAGFVTGGGWVMSLPGAYLPDLTLTGKATFGFVSQYHKGATVPTGNTEFQFQTGNMDFKSTAYTWMVVSGSLAQYQGTGTINGSGTYYFMLTAKDGALQGKTTPDGFRIKIATDSGLNNIVYDNKLSSDNSMTSGNTEDLGGGSIVIHSK